MNINKTQDWIHKSKPISDTYIPFLYKVHGIQEVSRFALLFSTNKVSKVLSFQILLFAH